MFKILILVLKILCIPNHGNIANEDFTSNIGYIVTDKHVGAGAVLEMDNGTLHLSLIVHSDGNNRLYVGVE